MKLFVCTWNEFKRWFHEIFTFPDFGDRLCDLNRYTDALCAYGQALIIKNQNRDLEPGDDCLFYFAQAIGKLTAKVQAQVQQQQLHPQQQQQKRIVEDHNGGPTDFYILKAGEPSHDPLSCPQCFGVLVEPVTLPCGHTYCRSHVINAVNPSLCIMVRNLRKSKVPKYGIP